VKRLGLDRDPAGKTAVGGDAQPVQDAQPEAKVAKTGSKKKTERTEDRDRVEGGGKSRVQVDAPVQSPPIGMTKATPDAIRETAGSLRQIASSSNDPELKTVLENAARAEDQLGKVASLPTPTRFKLKESKTRPEVLTGWIDRRVGGPKEDPFPKTRFNPEKELGVKGFAVPPDAFEGLRSGAKVELKLEQTENGEQTYSVRAPESEYATSFIGTVVKEGGKYFVTGVPEMPVYSKVELADPRAKDLVGQQIIAEVSNPASLYRKATVGETLGDKDAISAHILRIAVATGAPLGHSVQAMQEVEEIRKTPLEGKDFRHLPFITIDNEGSKDLDQAMCIQKRKDGGYDVHYAIADVAYFVKEGSALDREARRRATTTYLPGQQLTMLPKDLCEDLISLLPNVDRRAMIVSVSLDKNGDVIGSSFDKGVIHSRAQLTYKGVQEFHDKKKKGPLAGKEYTETLDLLRTVGDLRIKQAAARGVVNRMDQERELGLKDGKVDLSGRVRVPSDKWNEQISLLANEAVAKRLHEAGVKAIFRNQPSPDPDRIEAFGELCAAVGLPMKPGQTLDQYIASLDMKHPMAEIVMDLAVRTNTRASYEEQPAGHNALGLDFYLHFTAPMRRYVDVINARVLSSVIDGEPAPYQKDEDYRLTQVVKLADDARTRERFIEERTQRALTAYFWKDNEGKVFDAQVVAIRPTGVKVRIENGLEMDIPPRIFRRFGDDVPPELVASGAALQHGRGILRLGEKLKVTSVQVDPQRELAEIAPVALLEAQAAAEKAAAAQKAV
jgi:VacB/RNase II family 3'-5' exoribonuclease